VRVQVGHHPFGLLPMAWWLFQEASPEKTMATALLNSKKPIHTEAPDFPLFKLGQVVATPSAIDLLRSLALNPLIFLCRHSQGDWGNLDEEDRQANREALKNGNRLLSSYQLTRSDRLWIITEASRASTTLLLPEEY